MTSNIYIDLDTIKRHLNIDPDYTDEDEYLMNLSEVAVTAIENHIDSPISRFIHDGELPAPLLHAALLLIGNYYQNRESESIGHIVNTLPHGYEYLLQSYIDYQDNACR